MKTLLVLLLLSAVASADTLSNGLNIIVEPDPTVNSIVVYVRYRGGYTEDANTILLDRLFADAAQDERLDAIGGYAVSNYEAHHMDVFEVVPAGALELALWFEAKRMARFEITQPQLDAAKTSVLADYVDPVDAAVDTILWHARGERRSSPKKLEAATVDQIVALARVRLVPANATLVIAGRVDASKALAMARRYFGGIPRGETANLVWEDHVAPKREPVVVSGPESKYVLAVRVPLGYALVVEQLLGIADIDAEIRANEELRITGADPQLPLRAYLAVVQASEKQLEMAKRAAKTKLLMKLESLPYRASVLADATNLAMVRRMIDISADQLQSFDVSAGLIEVHTP